jgi:ribosome-binding protein aMBF1 (putative translation factor)
MNRKSFADEIREAVRRSGRSNYDIAKAINTAPSTLWRFIRGQSGISIEKLNQLAEVLDLHVTVGHKEEEE